MKPKYLKVAMSSLKGKLIALLVFEVVAAVLEFVLVPKTLGLLYAYKEMLSAIFLMMLSMKFYENEHAILNSFQIEDKHSLILVGGALFLGVSEGVLCELGRFMSDGGYFSFGLAELIRKYAAADSLTNDILTNLFETVLFMIVISFLGVLLGVLVRKKGSRFVMVMIIMLTVLFSGLGILYLLFDINALYYGAIPFTVIAKSFVYSVMFSLLIIALSVLLILKLNKEER